MRTALLLVGHIRTYDKTYDNLKKYILDYYNCDIFISTYNTIGSKHSHISDDNNSCSTPINLDSLTKLYNPKDICVIEDKPENGYYIKTYKGFNLGQFNCLYNCNNLKVKYETENNFKYDLVVRTRFDLMLNSINYNEIKLDCLNYPRIAQIWSDGMSDQFAISNSNIMDIYSDYINNKEKLLKDPCRKHPEILLKTHLLNNNVSLNKINVEFDLIRLNGKVITLGEGFHK